MAPREVKAKKKATPQRVAVLSERKQLENTTKPRGKAKAKPKQKAKAKPKKNSWPPSPERAREILDRLEARASEEGNCFVIDSKSRRPQYRERGQKCVTVQRAVWLLRGHTLGEGDCVTSRCLNPKCISEKHLFSIHIKKLSKRASAHKRRGNEALRAAKISASNEYRKKISDAQVLDIRSSKEPSKVLAHQYGVNKSLINKIRAGTARRTVVAGIWSQLIKGGV